MSDAPKIAVSMLDFLRTGQFGPVHLGISRDNLRGFLGKPEAWGPHTRKVKLAARAGVWKYGDIEFHFGGDMLWLIFSDHIGTLKGGRLVDLDPWILSGSLTVTQALREFDNAGIACERIDWKFNDGTERFRVGAGVSLTSWDATQSSSNDQDLPPLAPANMTFSGISYSATQKKVE